MTDDTTGGGDPPDGGDGGDHGDLTGGGDGADSDDAGHVDPDLPSEGGGGNGGKGGKVLTPKDLDISESKYVEQLDDDGRYVVSPGGGPPNVSRSDAESDAPGADRRRAPDGPDPSGDRRGPDPGVDGPRTRDQGDRPASPEAARGLLASELARADARYGVDVVGRFNGQTVRHRTVSNDVVATFENLVQWYAQHVTDEASPDEVLDILLQEATFTDGSTTPNLAELLEAHGLETTDSIEDLVEAINAEANREG